VVIFLRPRVTSWRTSRQAPSSPVWEAPTKVDDVIWGSVDARNRHKGRLLFAEKLTKRGTLWRGNLNSPIGLLCCRFGLFFGQEFTHLLTSCFPLPSPPLEPIPSHPSHLLSPHVSVSVASRRTRTSGVYFGIHVPVPSLTLLKRIPLNLVQFSSYKACVSQVKIPSAGIRSAPLSL
jgi:hypothetical protein